MRDKSVFGGVVFSAAVLLGGCVGHASGYAEADAPVAFVAEPTLVLVEPGIWVVRDYDYSVYYVDDYYWVYRNDVWHRSRTYDGGWATVDVSVVPRPIVSRNQHAYVHYHGGPNAQTRGAPRERGSERGRPGRADERKGPPPERNGDDRPRGPERADDRHDPAADHRRDEDHANDRPAAPHRDDHPGADPHGDQHGRRDDDKREEHQKTDDGKRDEKRKQNDEQKRGDKGHDHDHDKR